MGCQEDTQGELHVLVLCFTGMVQWMMINIQNYELTLLLISVICDVWSSQDDKLQKEYNMLLCQNTGHAHAHITCRSALVAWKAISVVCSPVLCLLYLPLGLQMPRDTGVTRCEGEATGMCMCVLLGELPQGDSVCISASVKSIIPTVCRL